MLFLLSEVGTVFWAIVFCGLVALAVFVERSLYLHRVRILPDDFLKGIFNILRRNNITEAVTICEETPGPVSYLVKAAILHRHADKEGIESAVDEAGRLEISRMERRFAIIATVAQIAPLLGLLGTVIAMIRALMVMEQQAPLVQSADIARWLVQALVATAAGLTVAIPCHVAYSFLVTRVEKIVLDMERTAFEIVAFLATPAEREPSAPAEK